MLTQKIKIKDLKVSSFSTGAAKIIGGDDLSLVCVTGNCTADGSLGCEVHNPR